MCSTFRENAVATPRAQIARLFATCVFVVRSLVLNVDHTLIICALPYVACVVKGTILRASAFVVQ